MMLGFILWSIVALIFVAIGISGLKSKEAVGFFTGVKAPAVDDVKKYNRAVSVLWFVSAVLLEITGIPLLFFEQNSPIFILMIFGSVAIVIGMTIGYIKIEHRYHA